MLKTLKYFGMSRISNILIVCFIIDFLGCKSPPQLNMTHILVKDGFRGRKLLYPSEYGPKDAWVSITKRMQ